MGAYGTGPVVFPGYFTEIGFCIRRDEELLEDLKKAGYRKGQRMFTPRQVEILVDHLGDPETWNI